MRVSACPQCASLRLRMPSVGDGGVLGYSILINVVCEECGFRGSPLILDSEEDYQSFRNEVAGMGAPLEGDEAERAADQEERAALSPDERAFLEDAQQAGEPRRPTFTVIVVTLAAAGLMVATAMVGWSFLQSPRFVQDPFLRTAVFAFLVGLQILYVWSYLRIARRMWVKATMG